MPVGTGSYRESPQKSRAFESWRILPSEPPAWSHILCAGFVIAILAVLRRFDFVTCRSRCAPAMRKNSSRPWPFECTLAVRDAV